MIEANRKSRHEKRLGWSCLGRWMGWAFVGKGACPEAANRGSFCDFRVRVVRQPGR